MRVGLIIYGTLETVSGGFLYDRKLVEHLRKSGHTVDVIGIPWRRYAAHLLDNLRMGLIKRLRQADYDVLLQDELNHPSLTFLNRRLKSQASYPIVSIVHHLRVSERHPPALVPLYRLVERLYLESVDAFIYNSETTRQVVESLLDGSTAHTVALPSGSHIAGLDPATIAARALQERPLQIVFVGNVIPRKGLHTLVEALVRMPADAARLTVIGDTSANAGYVREIRRMVMAHDLEQQVAFGGSMTQSGLATQLAASDALAVPSLYEGYGIVYLEGMAFGLPAIATTAGAAGEIITPGVDGFLVPPEDPDALADRLQMLEADRRRLRGMSLAARRRFDAQPTWDETTIRIESFLKSLSTTPP